MNILLLFQLILLYFGSDTYPWSETLSRSARYEFNKVIEDEEGDLVAVGRNIGNLRPVIMRIRRNGSVIWSHTYSIENIEDNDIEIKDVRITSDNRIFVFGWGYDRNTWYIGLVFAVDFDDGAFSVSRRFYDHVDTKNHAFFNGVIDLPNGNYLLYGGIRHEAEVKYNPMAVEIVLPGFSIIRKKEWGDDKEETSYKMVRLPDGRFAGVGVFIGVDKDMLGFLLDDNLNVLWDNIYDNSDRSEWGRGVDYKDGEILACSDSTIYILDPDNDGSILRKRRLEPTTSTEGEGINDCKFMNDGQILLVGGLAIGSNPQPTLIVISNDLLTVVSAHRYNSELGELNQITKLGVNSYLIAGYLKDEVGTTFGDLVTQGEDGLILEVRQNETVGGLEFCGGEDVTVSYSLELTGAMSTDAVARVTEDISDDFSFTSINAWFETIDLTNFTIPNKFCWSCHGEIATDSTYRDFGECRGIGDCMKDGTCFCMDGMYPQSEFTDSCEYSCYGEQYLSVDACSGFTCSGPDYCTCSESGVRPEDCYFCNSGIFHNESGVCDPIPNSYCASENNCSCLDGYIDHPSPSVPGDYCSQWRCGEYRNTDPEACSGMKCDSPNNCTCNESVPPEDCFFCDFLFHNDSEVCKPRPYAYCASQDNCTCIEGYFDDPGAEEEDLSARCSMWSCEGRVYDDPTVCTDPSFGTCDRPGPCNCTTNIFGPRCSVAYCGRYMSNQTGLVCNDRGTCHVGNQSCTCEVGYITESYCVEFTCYGFTPNDTENVCSNHGECVGGNDCSCMENYTSASDCSEFQCYGIDSESSEVCNSHGYCHNHDDCDCWTSQYSGPSCGDWTCYGISLKADPEFVCGGHGACVDIDFCNCLPGYYSLEMKGNCTEWSCGVYDSKDEMVCTGRGDCVSSHVCSCDSVDITEYTDREESDNIYVTDGGGEYEGQLCESFSCGLPFDSDLTCGGNGECLAPNICQCDKGYKGDLCSTNTIYTTVLLPILSATSGIIILVILSLLCYACIICCVCICSVMVLVLGLSLLGILFCFQKIRLKKFDKLKNVDLLLIEQEHEEDASVAHLRINKSLFEIPFEEIKTEKVLGQGGSQSVVFKAQWRSLVVAFKCFKTRNLCTSQDSFNEFEKEVEILSSLSHPAIVRFFGATMKPPRVGIVMEFCGNGEILDFYHQYSQGKEGEVYPINEKIRQSGEIVTALSYCHSRNVIHRDLKCENVLVDNKENAKLMDFGLSKVVDSMGEQNMTKSVGTSIYMAPEVVTDNSYSEYCDVFSFGIMMFVLLTENEHPYGKNEFRIEFKVASNPNFRPDLTELDLVLRNKRSLKWLKYIIKRSWSQQAKYRLSFSQIHELFEEHLDAGVDHSRKSGDDGDGIKDGKDENDEDEDDEVRKLDDFEKVMKENEVLKFRNEEMEMEILNLKGKMKKLNELVTTLKKN